MPDIFISYKREDVALARSLAARLQQEGWSVWWDHEIPAGRDYDSVIETELNNSKCVIVLWTQTSIQSRNVKDEANVALKQNKLLPVLVGTVQAPLGFRMVQAMQWNANSSVEREEMDNLKNQVRQLITDTAIQPQQVKVQVKRSFRKGWIWAGAVILFLITWIAFDAITSTATLTAAQYFAIGDSLEKSSDFKGAIESYTEAIRTDSNMEKAYYRRGYSYLVEGNRTEAISDLERSTELGNHDAFTDLGWTYFDQGNYEYAIWAFDQIPELKRNSLEEAGLAMSYLLFDDSAKARVHYENSIRQDEIFDGDFAKLESKGWFLDKHLITLKNTYRALYPEKVKPQ